MLNSIVHELFINANRIEFLLSCSRSIKPTIMPTFSNQSLKGYTRACI